MGLSLSMRRSKETLMPEQFCSTHCDTPNSTDKSCSCSSGSSVQTLGTSSVATFRSTSRLGKQQVRTLTGMLSLGVACLTSPCCVPLITPVILGLMAGTPAAVWLTVHMSWLYGALTLVSALSFTLTWVFLKRKEARDEKRTKTL